MTFPDANVGNFSRYAKKTAEMMSDSLLNRPRLPVWLRCLRLGTSSSDAAGLETAYQMLSNMKGSMSSTFSNFHIFFPPTSMISILRPPFV